MTNENVGKRLYEFSRQALCNLLHTGRRFEILDGIPEGATVTNAGYDPERRVFYFEAEHESFRPVVEGGYLKSVTVKTRDEPDDLSGPSPNAQPAKASTAIHRAFLSSPIDPIEQHREDLSAYEKGWYDALKVLDNEDPKEEDTP